MKKNIYNFLVPLLITIGISAAGTLLSSCEDSHGLDANIREQILAPDTVRDTLLVRDTLRDTTVINKIDTIFKGKGYLLPDSIYLEIMEVPIAQNDSTYKLQWNPVIALISAAIDTAGLLHNKIHLNLSISKTFVDSVSAFEQVMDVKMHLADLPVNKRWHNLNNNILFRILQQRPRERIIEINGYESNARIYLQDFTFTNNSSAVDCYLEANIPTGTAGVEIIFRVRALLFYSKR